MSILVHKINQRGDVLHRRVLQNTVPQIENVARFAGDAIQNTGSLFLYFRDWGKENDRIEIPLDGHIVTQLVPGCGQIDAPIDTDDVTSRCFEQRQQTGGTSAKMYQRYVTLTRSDFNGPPGMR